MLTALALPALPRLRPRLPAPARRQDSSGSSSSYHTAPGSPEPPDSGPDAEGRASWPWVAPGQGAGAQPRLSVSAQNSRQQPWAGSGFPRGPGSGPRPPQPQLRMLPSGEMEVIFSTGPLFGRSDGEDREVQQLTAPACSSPSPPRPSPPVLASPQLQAPDGGARWATYLELQPRGPSPASSTQFECVEVALEERTAPVRNRTVPKRQIELRARPRSPPQATGAPRPRLLLRTGSLDESLGRLQAAASLVQTALARKLSPAAPAPAPSSATFGPTVRPEPAARETVRSSRVVPEEARSRPPRAQDSSAAARAPRPWPSLRERAIRRDKPAPGTEPLGPVSSSIFLQSEEKSQEVRNQGPKTRFSQGTPGQTVPRARSPPFESRAPWEVPSRAVRPRSPSPPWQAPNGAVRGPRCPSPPSLSARDHTIRRVSNPSFPEASSATENRNPAVEETVSRRNLSPPAPSPLSQGGARARSPSPEAPFPWEAAHPAIGDALERGRSPSPSASCPRGAPDRPAGTWSPSPQEIWDPAGQDSPAGFARGALNGEAREEAAPRTPSAPATPEPPDAQSRSTREIPDLGFPGCQLSPEVAAVELSRGHLVGTPDAAARPEASSPGEAALERPRVTIPRPRDVRKIVKTTYAPSFPAAGPASAPPAPPAGPCSEEGAAPQTHELQALGASAPAHYTSVFLKDFLPVVPHPYEPPELPLDTVPREAPQPNGAPRRRAENSTAKPFARTEIRLPGALALGRRPEGTSAVRVRGPGGQSRGVEAQRLVPDGGGRTSPPAGVRTSPQRSPVGPCLDSPQGHPNSSPGAAPKLETPPADPEPAAAAPAPLPPEARAPAGRMAPRQPRAASAPPTDRSLQCASQAMRKLPAAAQPGKVLVDPESGRYYVVEAPRQPRLRLLFDTESGQYVEVLLPPSSPAPPRHVYAPMAVGPGFYPPAYGPIPGFSLPPSPGPPALSSPQLPWASEPGLLDGLYHLAPSGTPSPAAPLLLCAPPPSSGPAQLGKGTLFPL
uniref:Proline rich basic protein 1 n=1 Tax=Oryctolagus cuniculus TaxID=9986 RepID=G1SS20_RABIT